MKTPMVTSGLRFSMRMNRIRIGYDHHEFGNRRNDGIVIEATSNENYLESTLLRYPDVRILSTSEVADEFGDLDKSSSEFSNKIEKYELNFDELVNRLVPFKRSSVVSSAATEWPWQQSLVCGPS